MGLRVFGDQAWPALAEMDPHFTGTVIEFLIAFGRCADIDVVNSNIHFRVHLLEQYSILNGIHTAEVGAGRIVAFIPGADTVDEGQCLGRLMVTGTD